MKNRVITISREFGSGGRTIGKKVTEKLGIPCYDAEIIQEMAKETGFAPDYVKEAGEYASGSFLSSAFSNRMFGPTNEDILWDCQYKIITQLAEKEPCVIVGRCADYILQDRAGVPRIRFHDLRHSFATLSLEQGMDIKTVSHMLGHKDAGFTMNTYMHVTDNMQQSVADTMETLLDSSVKDSKIVKFPA